MLGSHGIVVKCMGFSCQLVVLGSKGIVVKCMAIFMPIGCDRFAKYCGKMYSFFAAHWLC